MKVSDFSEKNRTPVLFSSCGSRTSSVNTASPKRNGDGDGRKRRRKQPGLTGKSEDKASVDTLGNRRINSFLSERSLFDIDDEEGICGRFGRFGDDRFAYRLTRVLAR